MKPVFQFIKLTRVHHWIKNSVIWVPMIFAGKALKWQLHLSLFWVLLGFSVAASIIYIINDYVDIEKDRKHPEKKSRPLASGYFSAKQAFLFVFFLSFILILLIVKLHAIGLYIMYYFILNIAYTFWLKNIPIIDVSCISLGFIIRVIAGGLAAESFVSHWLIIILFLLTISIAFAKRRDDFTIDDGHSTFRKSQEGYNLAFLDIAKSISFSITLMSYILYSLSDEVMVRMQTKNLYITSFFVFLGIMRYLQISVVYKKSGSPVKLLFKDHVLQFIISMWVISFIWIIYVA